MRALFLLLICLLSFNSCYAIDIQSEEERPVALHTQQVQTGYRIKKFSHTFHQYYVLGIVPYDFWNEFFTDSRGLTTGKYVDFALAKEPDAIAFQHIRVRTERTAEGFVGSVLVSLVPVLGGLISGNFSIIVSGEAIVPVKKKD